MKGILFIITFLYLFFGSFFVFKWFYVIWDSMSPYLANWDVVLVQTKWYWKFKRWDVIAFERPETGEPTIKRIIGLPGETVKIESGMVKICNNEQCSILDESYLPSWIETHLISSRTPEFIIENGYFVLWDNRAESSDSRSCFSLDCTVNNMVYEIEDNKTQDDIIGKVIYSRK